jgi:hypothetical protein
VQDRASLYTILRFFLVEDGGIISGREAVALFARGRREVSSQRRVEPRLEGCVPRDTVILRSA